MSYELEIGFSDSWETTKWKVFVAKRKRGLEKGICEGRRWKSNCQKEERVRDTQKPKEDWMQHSPMLLKSYWKVPIVFMTDKTMTVLANVSSAGSWRQKNGVVGSEASRSSIMKDADFWKVERFFILLSLLKEETQSSNARLACKFLLPLTPFTRVILAGRS
jgi:hypothetical protein